MGDRWQHQWWRRVYRTTDGGQTWEETFRNQEVAAFFNCIDFAPGDRVGLG